MPNIGQTFSPAFLQALVQRAEGDKNRNFEAAVADRKLKLQQRQLQMGADQQDINNQFRSWSAGQTGSAAKSQIELLKEKGRHERAMEGNALKAAIEQAKIDQKEKDRQQVKIPDVEGKNMLRAAQSGKASAQTETIDATRPGEVAKLDAQAGKYLADADLARKRIEKLDNDFAEGKRTAADRDRYLRARAANLENMVTDRNIKRQMRKEMDDFAKRLGKAKTYADLAALGEKWVALQSTFDRYNQSLSKRLGKLPTVEREAIEDARRAVWKQMQWATALIGGDEDAGAPAGPANPRGRVKGGDALSEGASGLLGLPGVK